MFYKSYKMSELGTDRSRILTSGPFTLPTHKVFIAIALPIIDGKITFHSRESNITYIIPVVQLKTRKGSYTADKMKKPSQAHLEIITYLFYEHQKHGSYAFKPEKLFKHFNKWMRKTGKKPRKSSNGFVGRCSELARKNILEPCEYSQYRLNYNRALQVLNRMEF